MFAEGFLPQQGVHDIRLDLGQFYVPCGDDFGPFQDMVSVGRADGSAGLILFQLFQFQGQWLRQFAQRYRSPKSSFGAALAIFRMFPGQLREIGSILQFIIQAPDLFFRILREHVIETFRFFA